MKNVLAIVAVAGIAAAASAQISAPVMMWEVSTDGGATYSSAAVVAGGVVRVRGSLAWVRGGLATSALAAVTFDGSITGSLAETTGAMVKPLTQGLGAQAGAGVNLGGGNMRFSRTTDSGLAGSNTNYWTIGQDANIDSDGDGVPDTFPGQNTSNPVAFLFFDINIDASANHTLNVSAVLSPNTGSSSPIRIYNNTSTGGSSTFQRANTTVLGATIQVLIPPPGSLALLGLGGLAVARRRR